MAFNRLILLALLFIIYSSVSKAQDETPEIDYCKYPDGKIIAVGEGSPCPTGAYPL